MIPKILHIIWVGDESRQPHQLIQTWVDHHPDWQVMVWGNQDLIGRHWRCQQQIRYWGERDCSAVADIMRWEILQEHGGVCVAADSVCLRPLDEALLELNTFACWVNELVEPGKVSAAYVGCSAGNPLIGRVIEDIASTSESDLRDKCFSVGSGRLTATWRSMAYAELTVLPSYCFIPRHPGAPIQRQSGQPFACELWPPNWACSMNCQGSTRCRLLTASPAHGRPPHLSPRQPHRPHPWRVEASTW
jgi:Glycosyltransferase sugar-binding region containing DXD motif